LPSLIYDIAVDGMAAGSLAFGADSFAVMLVSGYTPNKSGHTDTADVTGEVSGTGYTAGGAEVGVIVDVAADNQTAIELGGATWPVSTISATGAVYYQQAADMLVAYIDFGGTISSLAGSFTLQPSTITIHNP
jgi:hypothetical protein